MSYGASVLADSVGPHGVRLTTLEATFPRLYLAEFNTHRRFSRNSESSRAIPTEERIRRVMEDPYIPEFRVRSKGMYNGAPLEGRRLLKAKRDWLDARDSAVEQAKKFLDVAKDDANRLLEPFSWHTVIVTATEWDNFFNLRCHEAAAIPMQRIGRLMQEAMWGSTPLRKEYGDWHLPLVSDLEYSLILGGKDNFGAKVSAGRCARSSFSNHMDPEVPNDSAARWERLAAAGHWSPGEHAALCVMPALQNDYDYGNFDAGWLQLRKMYPGEAVFSG